MRITVHPNIFVLKNVYSDAGDIDMRTESGMNNMNMESTNDKARAKNMRRRILACVCAVAIAVLQCAVIVTVGTEDVHAAQLSKIEVEYSDGTKARVNITTGTLIGYQQETKTLKDEEGNDVEISGPTIGTILNKNNIEKDIKRITITGGSEANKSDILVLKIGGSELSSHKVWSGEDKIEDLSDASGTLGVVKKNEPIKFKTNPSINPDPPKAEKDVTISYELEVDPFYASSESFDEDSDTEITWSSTGPIKLKTTKTSGLGKKTLTGSVTKEGDITITPKSNSFSAESGAISRTAEPPETKPTKKSINKTSVTVKSVVYDGRAKKPKPVVKDGSKTLKEGTDYKITGYKNNTNVGTGTVSIAGIGNYTGNTTATFKITDKTTASKASTKKTTKRSTSKYRTSARTGTYRTYTPRTVRPTGITSSTGTTVPNVTYAPDRTITVKEVFLGQQITDDPQENPSPADMMEEGWDDMNEDESNDWDDTEDMSLDFGPMAGSAAVAVGACGAGVVGRIRKFKLDTATKAVEQITNTKGKK